MEHPPISHERPRQRWLTAVAVGAVAASSLVTLAAQDGATLDTSRCAPVHAMEAEARQEALAARKERKERAPIDLTDDKHHSAWLRLEGDSELTAGKVFWGTKFPIRQDMPDDAETLAFADNLDDTADPMQDIVMQGQFIGRAQSIAMHFYRWMFIGDEYPIQTHLQISIEIDDQAIFDGTVEVLSSPGRPDACHTGHYGSYFTTFVEVDDAMRAAGLDADSPTLHDMTITLAPAGTGLDGSSPIEGFGFATSVTASSLLFNNPRYYGPVTDLLDHI